MTTPELTAEVNRIVAHLSRVPKRERKKAFLDEINKLPASERDLALTLISTMVDLSEDSNTMRNWGKITMIASGGGFIVILLAVAIFIPNPTPFQIFTFRVILAVAAGAFGCALPGFLNIESHWKMLAIRAGGAMGLVVLIYTTNPPKLIDQAFENARTPQNASQSGVTNSAK